MTIGFHTLNWTFAGNEKRGEISSVETTRLFSARTETRHDFLAHGDLLRVSLYGRQGRDSVLGSTVDFYSQSALTHNMLESKLKLELARRHACNRYAVVDVIIKGTCLRTN